ncbi:hypothetical protein V9T40_009434 [Parthenolecanium corni]|uniref:Uncharacterized protein n=1 Tax=Parthenolecanium corni TaxID=536013 RepID=A0AAN9TQ01_9HEMI
MAAGLFIFVCVLTDSFAGLSYTSEAHSWSIYDLRRSRDYKYGWCFLTAAVGCIFVEMVAVLCITVHYRRCQTIALMIKNIVPLIEDKTSNTYFATNDKGLLMKADEEKAKVDLKSSPCEETHGVTSETPPDICSTFLNAEQSDIDLESDERTVSTASARDVHLDMAPHSQNKLAKRANFATLNTRNYRCLNYPTVRKYSTLGGCNLLTMERGTNPPASSSNFNQVHCHQKTCAQSTMPRMKTACVNTNKYHTTDRHAKMAELQQLSCDDFNL